MNKRHFWFALGVAGVTAVACGNDGNDGGTGGSAGSGGSGASGGTSGGSGGSGGSSASGGAAGTGGSSGKGGTAGTAGKGGTGGKGGSGGSTGGTGPKIDPTAPRFAPGSCNLDAPAFCDNFETANPGGRGGDINEAEWSFARHGHMVTAQLKRSPASDREFDGSQWANTPSFCGAPFSNLLPPNDVRLCDGNDAENFLSKQLNEVYHDFGDFAINSMRIRQPIDFAGRTGTIVFDVDAKLNDHYDGHGWWIEMWITEDAAPIPYHGAPTVGSYPRRGIGFQIAPRQLESCGLPGFNEVGGYFITDNYEVKRQGNFLGKCYKAKDGELNRFRVTISQSQVDFYVTNWDAPAKVPSTKVASLTGLNLPFSRGYVHFQHSQYNAPKADGASSAQTYRWDNIAFDGPTIPRPRGYDVADELSNYTSDGVTGKSIGYYLGKEGAITPRTVTMTGVNLTDAVWAEFNFSFFAEQGELLRFRFNGKAWHEFAVPDQIGSGDQSNPVQKDSALRAFTVPVPLEEVVAGTNTVELTLAAASGRHTVIGNMDLTVYPSK